MSRRARSLVLAALASTVAVVVAAPAGAKTAANCRILTFDGAAGAASNDKVTFRAVDAAGVELDRSCLNQVQASETAQHYAQRLPGDWGDGQCVVPIPTPTPPATFLNKTCGNGSTGASCRHKYKLKNGAATVSICCYEGPNCKGNKLGKTNPARLPMSVQQKKDPAPAFGPTPVPIAVGNAQVALDPIGLTQAPFRESQGCREKLSKALLGHALIVLKQLARCHKLQIAGDTPPGDDCNSVNFDSDPNDVVGTSRENVDLVAQAACVPGGTPARLGYLQLCPAPCASVNRCTAGTINAACATDADCGAGGRCGPGDSWSQEVECQSCLIENAVTAAVTDKYGAVGPGVSPEAQKCQELIGDSVASLAAIFDHVTIDCQKKIDGGKLGLVFCQSGQCNGPPARRGQACATDDDCIDPSVRSCKYADMSGQRALAEAKHTAKIGSTCDATMIDELDTCGTDPASVSACVIDNARTIADVLADTQYPESVGHTPCVPGPLCSTATPGGPTPTVTPTPPGGGPCPSKMEFVETDPGGPFDLGWSGIMHDRPIMSDGMLTFAISGCANPSRPCGQCNLSGPIPNTAANAGAIDNRRCTGNTAVACTTNLDCSGPGGTCEFYAGTYQPLSAGGASVCVGNQVNGALMGTANIETGDTATTLAVVSRMYVGVTEGNPCPRCNGDDAPNNGIHAGTCSSGQNAGLACDVNGVSPNVYFGATSLDCPPSSGGLVSTLSLDFGRTTGTKTKTLSAASPNCRHVGSTGLKCLCDTCNNINAEPCSTNADCPDPPGPIGPICGGKRCFSGTNNGAACTNSTECPAGGSCTVPGEPTAPNACSDGTCSPNGGDPDGPNEGVCNGGPVEQFCGPTATFHGCFTTADCSAYPGDTCSIVKPRECFTDNGALGATVSATGAADVPVGDQSDPILAALFCHGPTTSSAVNTALGLPGLGRLEAQTHVRALP